MRWADKREKPEFDIVHRINNAIYLHTCMDRNEHTKGRLLNIHFLFNKRWKKIRRIEDFVNEQKSHKIWLAFLGKIGLFVEVKSWNKYDLCRLNKAEMHFYPDKRNSARREFCDKKFGE